MTAQTKLSAPDEAVAALLHDVGLRVRRAREDKGIPRRVLSEMSGVSPRYLAQLEAGEGNISIGLLHRVSDALDRPLDWFLAPPGADQADAQRVSELYADAPAEVQAEVLRLLDPGLSGSDRAQRVCLVGLRGAGKSTMGRMAGAALGIPFVELNDEIEDQSGMPVDEVMALYGNEGYRKLEAQALARVIAGHSKMILAVAGGIVAEPETYATLLRHFHTVWVKTSPGEHMARVRAQGDERPMAGNPEAMAQLRSILTAREALYQRALTSLDTSGKPVDRSLGQLVDLIRDHRFLE